MHRNTKLSTLAIAGGTATLVLTAAPVLASTHTSRPITGPESAYGVIHGKPAAASVPRIPLAWRGLVRASGVFSGHGHAPKKGHQARLNTSAGNLTMLFAAQPSSTRTFNPRSCHFTATTYVVFAEMGGESTGKFAGTTGPGAVKVRFAGYVRGKIRPQEGPVQHQPERSRAGERRGRVFRLERRADDVTTIA